MVLQRSHAKDTWNLVLVHLRKIPRSAGQKFRFSLQLYSKKHGFKNEFSNFCWGGAHRAPPQTLSPLNLRFRRRFSGALHPRFGLHPPTCLMNDPSPNRGYLTKHCFPKPKLSHWTQYFVPRLRIVGLIEIYQWKYPRRQAGRIFWKSNVMIRTRHTGTYTRNYCTRSFHFSPECTKIVSGWGGAPDPAGGAYSAPPDPLAVMGWDRDLVKTFFGV